MASGPTTTTVHQDSNGYYTVRVPKSLGDAFDLAGQEVTWSTISGQALRVTKE